MTAKEYEDGYKGPKTVEKLREYVFFHKDWKAVNDWMDRNGLSWANPNVMQNGAFCKPDGCNLLSLNGDGSVAKWNKGTWPVNALLEDMEGMEGLKTKGLVLLRPSMFRQTPATLKEFEF